MIIEINKDIEQYKESVALGLSAKQLIFSVGSILCGGGIVLLLYQYVGLTVSAYIAIPIVAPIALGGFYTFNNMTFYDVMKRKAYFMFANKALVYSSTECEQEIKDHMNYLNTEKHSIKQKMLRNLFGKKKERKTDGFIYR